MAPRSKCWRCHGAGFLRGPCQVCGALRLVDGSVVYQAGSVWGALEPPAAPVHPRKRPRADR